MAAYTTTFLWTFTCGHQVRQEDPNGTVRYLSSDPFRKSLQEVCPYCMNQKTEKTPQQTIQSQKDHRREDEQVLDIWTTQVDIFEKQIKEAEDQTDLISHLRKILDNCHQVWADKVRKTELKRQSMLFTRDGKFEDKAINQADCNIALRKIALLHSAELGLLERASRLGSNKTSVVRLKARCEALTELTKKIKGHGQSKYGEDKLHGALDVTLVQMYWKEVVGLIKTA